MGSTVWCRSPDHKFYPQNYHPARDLYLLLIVLPAEHDEEYEETEDEDDKAEEDGGDEAEDDVALLREVRSAGGGVGQGQGLTPVTAGGRAALGRQ